MKSAKKAPDPSPTDARQTRSAVKPSPLGHRPRSSQPSPPPSPLPEVNPADPANEAVGRGRSAKPSASPLPQKDPPAKETLKKKKSSATVPDKAPDKATVRVHFRPKASTAAGSSKQTSKKAAPFPTKRKPTVEDYPGDEEEEEDVKRPAKKSKVCFRQMSCLASAKI